MVVDDIVMLLKKVRVDLMLVDEATTIVVVVIGISMAQWGKTTYGSMAMCGFGCCFGSAGQRPRS